MNRLFLLFVNLLLLTGCASMKGRVDDAVKPLAASQELASEELLDVEITVFSSEELTEEQTQEEGLSEDIRQAEERFIPIHLKHTMQRSGYWGAVRVVPTGNSADVLVSGNIVESDGEILQVEIVASDVRGVEWFEKTYSETLRPEEHKGAIAEERDPFQDLYNTIANDLIIHRQELTPNDVREIQQVAELRFAHDMAPDAFDGHLTQDEDGHYQVQRLPVEDDPMLQRVRAVEVRDAMLVDTINSYYDVYYTDLWQPYADWRNLRSEEAAAMKEIEKQALTRQLLGLAAVVGGVLLTQDSNINASSLPELMVIGGAAAIYSGFEKQGETKIHKEVIEELSISFSSEAEPLVVEVIGETVRLTGSAEEQYQRWRGMLRQIYASETGLPLESENGPGAAAEPAMEVDADASPPAEGM
jgi:hypothetical protein